MPKIENGTLQSGFNVGSFVNRGNAFWMFVEKGAELSSTEDQGQTDGVNTPRCTGLRRCRCCMQKVKNGTGKVVHGPVLCDPIQPNPSAD